MEYQIRKYIPVSVKALGRYVLYATFTDGIRGYGRYLKSMKPGESAGDMHVVPVRPLGGKSLKLRGGTSDPEVVFCAFYHRYHLPPKGYDIPNNAIIWDLGANIGVTAADYARRYPTARVVAVEMDADNAEMARANTAPWQNRVEIVECAVWVEDGSVSYEKAETRADSFSLQNPSGGGRKVEVPAVTLNTLWKRTGSPPVVHFVKMDLEGIEKQILKVNTQWSEHVSCIKVELHGDYSKDECSRDLQALGFETLVDSNHSNTVVGIRP